MSTPSKAKLQADLDAAKQHIESLEQQIKAMPDEAVRGKDSPFWRPGMGDSFCVVTGDGDIVKEKRYSKGSHEKRLVSGNVYPSDQSRRLESALYNKKRLFLRVEELGGVGRVEDKIQYWLSPGIRFERSDMAISGYEVIPDWMLLPDEDAAETLMKEFTPDDIREILRLR